MVPDLSVCVAALRRSGSRRLDPTIPTSLLPVNPYRANQVLRSQRNTRCTELAGARVGAGPRLGEEPRESRRWISQSAPDNQPAAGPARRLLRNDRSPARGASALPHSRTPALTHSRTHALPHCRTAALPHSRTPALPHSRTPALPHSRTHALTHSRTPALTHCRTHALPHCRTPALTHSRTHALPHSRTPALPHLTSTATD
jgi:hypothetical protein